MCVHLCVLLPLSLGVGAGRKRRSGRDGRREDVDECFQRNVVNVDIGHSSGTFRILRVSLPGVLMDIIT